MDLLRKAAWWLEKTRDEFAAEEVSISRGTSSLTLRATRGRSAFEVDGADGVRMRIETEDFIFLVRDYAINDVPAVPTVADRITIGDDGTGPVYEVMCPAPGIPAWRYCDQHRLAYRVHARLVSNSLPGRCASDNLTA